MEYIPSQFDITSMLVSWYAFTSLVIFLPIRLLKEIIETEKERRKELPMKTKIMDYRKSMEMTQQQLADIVEVTRQTIISLEQGKYNPSLELAYRITKALKKRYIEDVFILE
jgi:putative transcriptional regulator